MAMHNKNQSYIIHNSKERATLFVFEDGSIVPSHLVKIYNKSDKPHLDAMNDLFERLNSSESITLKGSIPKLLKREEDCTHYLIYEEYVDRESMEARAKRRSFGWRKEFLKDFLLAAEWISQLHKNFSNGCVIIPADKISFLFEKVKIFLDPHFLKTPVADRALPCVVSHRDFRPENILADKDRITVIDWDKFITNGLPLFDLLEFVLRYFHAHYRFQKEEIYLRPAVFLKYFNLFYLKESALSKTVRDTIDHYCGIVGLNIAQRDTLLLLWIYNMLYIYEKDRFMPVQT